MKIDVEIWLSLLPRPSISLLSFKTTLNLWNNIIIIYIYILKIIEKKYAKFRIVIFITNFIYF